MSHLHGTPHMGCLFFYGANDLRRKSTFPSESVCIRTMLRAPSLTSDMYRKFINSPKYGQEY